MAAATRTDDVESARMVSMMGAGLGDALKVS